MDWIEPIKKYISCNEQEEKDKAFIIRCFELFDDILTRNNEIAHITSSAFAVNKNKDKVLMVWHNIYKSWSWTGGHADGDGDLLRVAIREAGEETGVKNIFSLSKDILSLDVIPVPGHTKKGRYVCPHLHLSAAYLVEADEDEPLVVKPDENSRVGWIPVREIDKYSSEPHMITIYKKIISKILSPHNIQ